MNDASAPTRGSEVPDVPDDADDAAAVHDAARLRGPKRLLLIGPPVAFGIAVASGLLGMDGSAGLVIFLLLLGVTFGVSGVWVGAGLLLDEFRGAPTGGRRGLLAAALFVATLVCMIAVGGVAMSTGGGA